MDMSCLTAAFKLPSSPYPGLRPFLNHESALLMGRSNQIREVIARLRDTHFVAVIGGSGSGKSSMVRAGVMPELRGFRIPEAGDYWIPVICTPGTTAYSEEEAPLQTPITRLAWKLSQVLVRADTIEERKAYALKHEQRTGVPVDLEQLRRDEIVTLFGQVGFHGLVDFFSNELPHAGPPVEDARFLFVIDQFEELFHPNNSNNPYAKQLIEAVIDHFFAPHPRCFVILTMRSEHLADCATFLELPDAINKSSYLMRRLDDRELRDAIIGPALYFQRLIQRGAPAESDARRGDIQCEPEVIKRLLADVGHLSNDPDHLPLLQHILARVWSAACTRENLAPATLAPAHITWADLERATDPDVNRTPGWLAEDRSVNTLRTSLENCAEAVYEGLPPAQRDMVDAVLRRLAFKDPNSAMYSQQRLSVDDPSLFPGVAHPRDSLKELLQGKFLDDVNYLFWDKENPESVTLKVSHEAFIRGWPRFRELIDIEGARFDEFVSVLRKCAHWSANQQDMFLLQASDLMRFKDAELGKVFDDADELHDWFRVLLLYHGGDHLARVQPRVREFLDKSTAQVEHEANARAAAIRLKRNFRMISGVLVAVILLLVIAYCVNYIQNIVAAVAADFARAETLAVNGVAKQKQLSEQDNSAALGMLLKAADSVASGNNKVNALYAPFAANLEPILKRVEEGRFVSAYGSREPVVNGTLRNLLTSRMWRTTGAAVPDVPGNSAITAGHYMECKGAGRDGQRGHAVFDKATGQGVFVPPLGPDESALVLFGATVDLTGACLAKSFMMSLPAKNNENPQVLFDGQLRLMLVVLGGTLTQYVIKWEDNGSGALTPSAVSTSATDDKFLVGMVRNEVTRLTAKEEMNKAASVPSRHVTGGYEWTIADISWRTFNDNAQLIDNPGSDTDWKHLALMGPNSQCQAVARDLIDKGVQPGFKMEVFQEGALCFAISRGRSGKPKPENADGPAEAGKQAARIAGLPERVIINVYRVPKDAARLHGELGLPQPIAGVAAFDNLTASGKWVIGTTGEYQGWIAHQRIDKGVTSYYGTPWDTAALSRLGREVEEKYQNAAGIEPKTGAVSRTAVEPVPK